MERKPLRSLWRIGERRYRHGIIDLWRNVKGYSGYDKYGKAISAHKEGAENYGEQELKALGSGLKARYGSDENHTNAFGSYKLKELATAKYVEIVGEAYNDNFASLVSGGSLIIISVVAVIALITAGVFAAL